MATESRQLSREELQLLADKTLKRREQQRERQRKIRQEKRAAGMQSSTHWHPKPPEGLVPCVVFMTPEMARDIIKHMNAGKYAQITERSYKRDVTEGGITRQETVKVWALGLS